MTTLTDAVRASLVSAGYVQAMYENSQVILRRLGVRVLKYEAARPTPGAKRWTNGLVVWAPAWAVFLVEADPLSEAARIWAYEKVFSNDQEFIAALDTVARLATSQVRAKVADFVLEQWIQEGEKS